MSTMIDWARGPLFVFALVFMLAGLVRHVVVTAIEVRRTLRRAGDPTLPLGAIATATLRWLLPLGKLGRETLFTLTSIVFHVSILVVPLLLVGHIALWERGAGLSWPGIPNAIADVLTILAVVAALLLVVQRLAARTTRSLSRPQDLLLPLIIAVPFASGFLLMHPALSPLSFQVTLLLHALSADFLLILIPITKLSHVVLMPSSQLVAELGWKWPADAGARVGASLGKEEGAL